MLGRVNGKARVVDLEVQRIEWITAAKNWLASGDVLQHRHQRFTPYFTLLLTRTWLIE